MQLNASEDNDIEMQNSTVTGKADALAGEESMLVD